MRSIGRRQFLSGAAKVAGLVGVGAAWPGLAWADPLGLPIGIQLYTVGSDIQADAPAAIRKIAAIGYREVETAGFGSLRTASEFRKVLDENGLKCPSAHVGFDLANLQKAFDDANALGCRYATSSVPRMMIVPPMDLATAGPEQRRTSIRKLMAPMTEEDSKRLAEAMNKVGEAASKAGLTFASHNHTEQFSRVGDGTAFDYLMAHTDPGKVKFEIDCGWATVAGFKPGDLVKKHPGRVKMLHIKDFLPFAKGAMPGGPIEAKGSEIGQGVVNYREIFAEVKGRGIEHIFVEQEGPYARMPAMQAAEADYKYLHGLPS